MYCRVRVQYRPVHWHYKKCWETFLQLLCSLCWQQHVEGNICSCWVDCHLPLPSAELQLFEVDFWVKYQFNKESSEKSFNIENSITSIICQQSLFLNIFAQDNKLKKIFAKRHATILESVTWYSWKALRDDAYMYNNYEIVQTQDP